MSFFSRIASLFGSKPRVEACLPFEDTVASSYSLRDHFTLAATYERALKKALHHLHTPASSPAKTLSRLHTSRTQLDALEQRLQSGASNAVRVSAQSLHGPKLCKYQEALLLLQTIKHDEVSHPATLMEGVSARRASQLIQSNQGDLESMPWAVRWGHIKHVLQGAFVDLEIPSHSSVVGIQSALLSYCSKSPEAFQVLQELIRVLRTDHVQGGSVNTIVQSVLSCFYTTSNLSQRAAAHRFVKALVLNTSQALLPELKPLPYSDSQKLHVCRAWLQQLCPKNAREQQSIEQPLQNYHARAHRSWEKSLSDYRDLAHFDHADVSYDTRFYALASMYAELPEHLKEVLWPDIVGFVRLLSPKGVAAPGTWSQLFAFDSSQALLLEKSVCDRIAGIDRVVKAAVERFLTLTPKLSDAEYAKLSLRQQASGQRISNSVGLAMVKALQESKVSQDRLQQMLKQIAKFDLETCRTLIASLWHHRFVVEMGQKPESSFIQQHLETLKKLMEEGFTLVSSHTHHSLEQEYYWDHHLQPLFAESGLTSVGQPYLQSVEAYC